MAQKREPPAGVTRAARHADHAGAAISTDHSHPAESGQARRYSAELHAVAIYDGRRLLGHVCERSNGQHEAAPASGPSLGLFNGHEAAVRAILAHARGGR